ncbi:MAG: hypothetical protein RMK94_15050 [Armatimonadota bacterium]|nr:hypothetical protein [Armatimonadota bacterium]
MVRRLTFALLMPFAFLALNGCGGSSAENATQTGNIIITFNFPPEENRLIPSATTQIIVTVGGEGLTRPLKGTATRTNPQVVFSNVPVGAKFILAFSRTNEASSLPATMGFAIALVTAGQTTRLEMELQPVRPPTRITSEPSGLVDNDTDETLFLRSVSGGIEWSGFASPRRTITFDTPLLLPNGSSIGQSVSGQVNLEQGQATARMKLISVTGIGVPAGDFANCVVLELSLTGSVAGVPLRIALYRLFLARNFGPVLLSKLLATDDQPYLGREVYSALVSGRVSGITPSPFSFASPVNKLGDPAYDGNLNAYLLQGLGNRYDFSEFQSQENPPDRPF